MSKTKECHYVPQVYLKQWSNDNKKVNILDKKSSVTKSLSIEKNFSERNLYNIKFGEYLTFINKFPISKKYFIENIQRILDTYNVDIFYKEKIFNLSKQNLGYLTEEENIEFFNDKGKVNDKNKNKIYSSLKQIKDTTIEDLFHDKIENKYNFTIEKINKHLVENNFNSFELDTEEINEIRTLMLSMLLRCKETPGLFFQNQEKNQRKYDLKIIFSNNVSLKKLLNYSERVDFLLDVYNLLTDAQKSKYYIKYFVDKNYSIFLYYIESKNEIEFCTSDCPCIDIDDALLMPLTSRLLLVASNSVTQDKNIIVVEKANDSQVIKYNNLILNSLAKCVIFKNKLNKENDKNGRSN